MSLGYSKSGAHSRFRKVDFDGAYLLRYDGTVNWRDRDSSYAASFAELLDGSLIYIAERLGRKWHFGLWNPDWSWQFSSLGACRSAIREDFKSFIRDRMHSKNVSNSKLYFPNMQWSRNYAFHRLEYDDIFDEQFLQHSSGSAITITYDFGDYDPNHPLERARSSLKGLDYTVWFVYAKLDGCERIAYVIERIGKKWLGARWDGAQCFAGTNLRECQGAIWAHMTKWYRSNDMRTRIERYHTLAK